jgi:hypothetical protein
MKASNIKLHGTWTNIDGEWFVIVDNIDACRGDLVIVTTRASKRGAYVLGERVWSGRVEAWRVSSAPWVEFDACSVSARHNAEAVAENERARAKFLESLSPKRRELFDAHERAHEAVLAHSRKQPKLGSEEFVEWLREGDRLMFEDGRAQQAWENS